MSDDDRLAELFHAAASDAGAPPAFDHGQVVTASQRITARRRAAITGALGVLAVVGIGTAVVLPGLSTGTTSTAAAPYVVPDGAEKRAAAPTVPAPAQAQAADSAVVPLGPGTTACADRQDPALRALVEQVLPEVVGAPAAATTEECRPAGERGVSVEVGGGLLTVQYLPPGVAAVPPAGAVSAPTVSGGTVIVSSGLGRPGDPVPLAGRLDAAAEFLADRL